MADRIHRITMFKLPSTEEQQRLLAQYKTLGATHLKVRVADSIYPAICEAAPVPCLCLSGVVRGIHCGARTLSASLP